MMSSTVRPKVSTIKSTEALSSSEAFGMLARFLKAEQQKQDPVSLQQSHWEELYRVSETMVDGDDVSDRGRAERKILRQLRLLVAPLSSPRLRGYDQDGVTKTRARSDSSSNLIPVDHTSSIKQEILVDNEDKNRKSDRKALKKEKKAKKEKKRKREREE